MYELTKAIETLRQEKDSLEKKSLIKSFVKYQTK